MSTTAKFPVTFRRWPTLTRHIIALRTIHRRRFLAQLCQGTTLVWTVTLISSLLLATGPPWRVACTYARWSRVAFANAKILGSARLAAVHDDKAPMCIRSPSTSRPAFRRPHSPPPQPRTGKPPAAEYLEADQGRRARTMRAPQPHRTPSDRRVKRQTLGIFGPADASVQPRPASAGPHARSRSRLSAPTLRHPGRRGQLLAQHAREAVRELLAAVDRQARRAQMLGAMKRRARQGSSACIWSFASLARGPKRSRSIPGIAGKCVPTRRWRSVLSGSRRL